MEQLRVNGVRLFTCGPMRLPSEEHGLGAGLALGIFTGQAHDEEFPFPFICHNQKDINNHGEPVGTRA